MGDFEKVALLGPLPGQMLQLAPQGLVVGVDAGRVLALVEIDDSLALVVGSGGT